MRRASKKVELRLIDDLGLSSDDLYYVKLKAYLYQMAAEAVEASGLTHEEIAKLVGTSRARISRLAKLGENSISIDFLIKLTDALYEKPLVVYRPMRHKLKPKKILEKSLARAIT